MRFQETQNRLVLSDVTKLVQFAQGDLLNGHSNNCTAASKLLESILAKVTGAIGEVFAADRLPY